MCLARHVKITLLHLSMKSSQIVLLLIVFMNFRSPIKADEIVKLAKKLKKEKINIAMHSGLKGETPEKNVSDNPSMDSFTKINIDSEKL